MHRQSLGSPSSKLVKDEQLTNETQKKQLPAAQSSSGSISISNLTGLMLFAEQECNHEEEEEEMKKKKMMRSSTPESYIHLIPMLTLLCFLILYLSSHNPSQNDLAQFNGVRTFSNPAADLEDSISELQRVVEMKKGDILVAVRSLKNLKPEEEAADTAKHRQLHRKIARF